MRIVCVTVVLGFFLTVVFLTNRPVFAERPTLRVPLAMMFTSLSVT